MKNRRIFSSILFAVFATTVSACYSQQSQTPNSQSDDGRGFARRPDVSVSNDQSPHFISITPNREELMYEEVENFALTVTSSADGYFYLVNLNPDNKLRLLFPNELEANRNENKIKQGVPVTYPPQGSSFVTEKPFGNDIIFAILATEGKLDLKDLVDIKFYEKRGLLRNQQGKVSDQNGKTISRVNGPTAPKVDVIKSDFACQTILVKTFPKGKRPTIDLKKQYAIVIGVNIYQEGFKPLPACREDAHLIKDMLIQHCQFEEANIFCLTGKEATKENILQLFISLSEKSAPGQEVYIYWSSHGGQAGDIRYLVLNDSLKSGDVAQNLKTYVTDTEFEHWLDDYLKGRRVVIFLDACHSEGMREDGTKSVDTKPEYFFDKMFARQDGEKRIRSDQAAILCSSGADHSSYVYLGKNYSIMTWFIIECIRNSNGPVTFDELCDYARAKVPPTAIRQYKDPQTPGSMNRLGTIYVKP